jgi:hypothetical protein
VTVRRSGETVVQVRDNVLHVDAAVLDVAGPDVADVDIADLADVREPA